MINNLIKPFFAFSMMILALLFSQQSRATMTIEITQGVSSALPIAIVPFHVNPNTEAFKDISAIIQNDLIGSGRFKAVEEKDFITRPHEGSEVNFRDWRLLDVPYLLIGKVISQPSTKIVSKPSGYVVSHPASKVKIQYELFDVFKAERMGGFLVSDVTKDILRTRAHQVSDHIYKILTGEKGVFSTRIMYVTYDEHKTDYPYSLQVSDIDGKNPIAAYSSPEIIMSPAWSSGGEWVAYVSYEHEDSSAIVIQNIYTEERRTVSHEVGINGAPAWSPDGKQLAMTLSKGVNPDIYILDLASGVLQRITRSYAIDTEPSWSPDGRQIVFTSDRGGSPHIYQYDLDSEKITRITFDGRENTRASYSPDGKFLTFIHRQNKQDNVAVMELSSGVIQVLSDGGLDESPSFSPDGSMIIYATQQDNRGVLAAVSVDGGFKKRLAVQEGDVREPAWAPFN